MLGCCHLQFIRSAVHLEPDIAFNSFSNPPFLQFIRSANALLRRVGSRFEGKNRYPNASKARQIQHGARRWALGSTREPPEKQTRAIRKTTSNAETANFLSFSFSPHLVALSGLVSFAVKS